ncbi:hypothetical protein SADUNF_Sadunf13G0108700 [Salix dunnii]|uniref:Uncharacterized protein n=1 Tax=Salix dunnii TaxID=1413687 RepID=A0A835MLB6_9ROSI|nr:hypothetical protein SADUNF_Sadunf13G0108700 [Salix dunnii]
MGDFEKQVKERAKELKVLFKKGVKIVENSCKKGWKKVKNLKKPGPDGVLMRFVDLCKFIDSTYSATFIEAAYVFNQITYCLKTARQHGNIVAMELTRKSLDYKCVNYAEDEKEIVRDL